MRSRAIAPTLVAVAVGLLSMMTPAASAQVGYPPGPPQTTVVPPTTGVPRTTVVAPLPANVVAKTLPVQAEVVGAAEQRPAKASGGVAFTGANILRWSLIALVLVALGAVLVVANRRRNHLPA